MKKDKLTLRTEIQKDFDNETIKNINIAINLSKVMRFLYSESTIFFAEAIEEYEVIAIPFDVTTVPLVVPFVISVIVTSVKGEPATGVELSLRDQSNTLRVPLRAKSNVSTVAVVLICLAVNVGSSLAYAS